MLLAPLPLFCGSQEQLRPAGFTRQRAMGRRDAAIATISETTTAESRDSLFRGSMRSYKRHGRQRRSPDPTPGKGTRQFPTYFDRLKPTELVRATLGTKGKWARERNLGIEIRCFLATVSVVSWPANESVDEARCSGLRRLGDLLKARRAGLRPEDVGLEPRGRRRVIGLRRHEVADIAGVSVTWYTWLEQGRDIHVSPQALDAIACALKQTDDAWRYMRSLAGIPVPELLVAAKELRNDLSVLVKDLPYPTCITTGPADLLGWNTAFSALFGDPSELPPFRRNTFWLMLTSPFLRDRVADFGREFADSVAMLRADAARYAGDPHFEEVVSELCADGRFRELWTSHEVRQFHGPHLTTLVLGPADVLRLQRYLLRPIDEPTLRMMIFKPVDTHSQQRLRTLLSGSSDPLKAL